MNLTSLLADIETGVSFIEKIAPVAAELGVPFASTVAAASGAVSDILTNVQDRVAEGKIVATSDDTATIDALAAKLDAVNTDLNAYIVAS